MNTQRLHLATLATMLVSTLAIGCASSTKVDAPSTPMTVLEAKNSLVGLLSKLDYVKSVRDVRFTRRRLTFKAEYEFSIRERASLDLTVRFADLRTLTIDRNPSSEDSRIHVKSDGKSVLSGPTRGLSFGRREDARAFADCLLVLKEAALLPDTEEEANFAAFSAAAKTWLAADPKPPMSDDARSSKAMAEDAFKRKEFAAAMDAYVEALERHPMWPEGHYNAALLAGEIEDYEVAARHMRRYLALAPDAKDASAAKDKYLLWQRKAKQ